MLWTHAARVPRAAERRSTSTLPEINGRELVDAGAARGDRRRARRLPARRARPHQRLAAAPERDGAGRGHDRAWRSAEARPARMDLGNLESLRYSAPELILIATAILVFGLDLVVRGKEHLGSIALFGCAVGARRRDRSPPAVQRALARAGPLRLGRRLALLAGWSIVDDFAVFFKLIFCLAAFATIWMSLGSQRGARRPTRASTTGSSSPRPSACCYMARPRTC